MNERLRKTVKLTKAKLNINYKDIAYLMGIKEDSFYSWLSGSYNFGYTKQQKLNNILKALNEPDNRA